MSDPNDWNAKVIKEFRENEGKVGGFFADKSLLLLHTIGAKSGQPRLHPLLCMEDGERLFIIASAGGAPKHPAWYHNIVANPAVEIEYGTERFKAKASVATEPERTALYEKASTSFAGFQEYAEKTASIRTIPVVTLERA